MKILVCDDLQDRRDEVALKIVDAGQQKPDVISEQELASELDKLFGVARECLKEPSNYKAGASSRFDGVDIVILDNNLTHLPGTGPLLTAESIAGYVRAFTTADYVVSLNTNPDVDFDLRFLVGDFTTRADLALNTDHLSNPALWSGNPTEATKGFLPWYWPRLIDIAERRRKQVDFVRAHLDHPVTEALGFDAQAIEFLSLHARGALSPFVGSEGKPIRELKFRDVFIHKDRSLPIQEDREKISNAENAGQAALRDLIARVVAADMDLWFRRDVCGPQEPLIDVAHLLTRFPFLLGDRVSQVEEWNKAARAEASPFALEPQLYDEHIASARFEHEFWVKNPSFWWPKLKADEKLNDYFLSVEKDAWPDLVFCEDRSQFVVVTAADGQVAPVEFPAEFEGSWSRRYVARIEGIQYAPQSRLAR